MKLGVCPKILVGNESVIYPEEVLEEIGFIGERSAGEPGKNPVGWSRRGGDFLGRRRPFEGVFHPLTLRTR